MRDMLNDIYSYCGETDWIKPHLCVFYEAFRAQLAIGGSVGLALGHRHPGSEPNDLDFVATSHADALAFIGGLVDKAEKYRFVIKVFIQNRTDWVPTEATAHYKIISSMWKDICVFVRPNVNVYYRCKGLRVQKYDDITKKAKELEKKDGKARCVNMPLNLDVDMSMPDDSEPDPSSLYEGPWSEGAEPPSGFRPSGDES